jgi:hypothetical protein
LQFGKDGVTEFLKGGFSKFSGGLPTIDGLKDFADRFRRVSEIAEILNADEAVAGIFAKSNRALRSVLDFDQREAAKLMERLSAAGTKFTRERLVRVAEVPGGVVTEIDAAGNVVKTDVVFLEIGKPGINRPAGLVHILEDHAQDFAARGIPEEQIADAVMIALKQGKNIGVQGATKTRFVYEFVFNGRTQYISITVGNNGFIVGANPTKQEIVDQLLRGER